MIPGAVCKALTLLFGVMYPAYASYKTVKNKNVKNYVKWMMYWIVFAAFICIESLTDIFLEFWFPFYYDIKLLVLLWISCPFTKGSTILYKQLVHPTLLKKETDIDEFLVNVKSRTYNALASTAKQTFQMTAAIVAQHTVVGRMPMILQQMVKLDDECLPQQPAAIVRKVKKKKPTTFIIEDSVSDSSSDSLPIASTIVVEEVPIQRPKRSKVQYQQKSSNTNKYKTVF